VRFAHIDDSEFTGRHACMPAGLTQRHSLQAPKLAGIRALQRSTALFAFN